MKASEACKLSNDAKQKEKDKDFLKILDIIAYDANLGLEETIIKDVHYISWNEHCHKVEKIFPHHLVDILLDISNVERLTKMGYKITHHTQNISLSNTVTKDIINIKSFLGIKIKHTSKKTYEEKSDMVQRSVTINWCCEEKKNG